MLTYADVSDVCRLRDLEKEEEQKAEREAMAKCEQMVAQGLRVWQVLGLLALLVQKYKC